ncbi:hypothetical protein, conserved [Plasmodium gonderi]|uniref:Uncharacterized protein n=1 Tax=Plasmodium gonderi TaxID=77519 RepID=A0A1Y1JF84_PLAGO|nr:hypothetical protein, conserved [Plasmodium gonderi]GAW81199.1 hypothetical protein, conserved [Plasmodium gonderi]
MASLRLNMNTSQEVILHQICEIVKSENIKDLPNHVQEKINHFLLEFYEKNKFFTCTELENINSLLALLISNFKESINEKFYEHILLQHFKNASTSFVKTNIIEEESYVNQTKQYFLCLLDLVIHLKKRKQKEKGDTTNSDESYCLIVSIVKYLNAFLVSTLRLIKDNCFPHLYFMIIREGKIIETLRIAYGQNEELDEDIIHSFLLLSERKEFDGDIIKCGILNKFITSKILLQFNGSYKNSLLIQVIINVIVRNLKKVNIFTSKSELQFMNSMLGIVYDKVKKENFDSSCIHMLRLISCIIEECSICIDSLLFSYHIRNGLHIEDNLFFENINKLITHVNCLVQSANFCNNECTKNSPFSDFLCVFFCILQNILQAVLNQDGELHLCGLDSSERHENLWSHESLSRFPNIPWMKFRKNEEMNREAKNMVRNILDLSLNFLDHNSSPLHEKVIPIMSHIAIQGTNEERENYLYVKYVEVLFSLCFYNEEVCKEYFTVELIKIIEKHYLELDKNKQCESVKKKEGHNLLKLYYFGILYTFIKINLNNENVNILLPFVNYIIQHELKKKIFLLENKFFYLLFLKFLNMSLLNNLYDFKKFVQGISFLHFLKIARGLVLNILLQWVERDSSLELIKTHVKKNKQIFHILLEFWVHIQVVHRKSGTNMLATSLKWKNVLYTIHYIFKRLTNGFTDYLNYFSENEDLLNNFKCVMTFQERTVLEIYSGIRQDIEANRMIILEKDRNCLNDKIKTLEEKIEQMEKRLHVASEARYQKNVNALENYYNYVRGEG